LFRPLSVIVSAILLSRPAMLPVEATRYARVLQEEAQKHAFDPLTVVAIVHFETRWHPGLISPDGEDYGLGQVRARFWGACRGDADPVSHPSDACRATKAALLDGATNLRRIAAIITANRVLCKQKTGTADLPQWLAGYEGLNAPSRDRWCAPSALTWRVVDYRRKLVDLLAPAEGGKLAPAVGGKLAPAVGGKLAPAVGGTRAPSQPAGGKPAPGPAAPGAPQAKPRPAAIRVARALPSGPVVAPRPRR
jgi:hypothetical protein